MGVFWTWAKLRGSEVALVLMLIYVIVIVSCTKSSMLSVSEYFNKEAIASAWA
jgi:hypothetical protein